LLLAAAARPQLVHAATVDHGFRAESASEAETVARLCKSLGIRHYVLRLDWEQKPDTAVQEKARAARYRLLGEWVRSEGLAALVTGHHLDDQAETLLMRLARGAGVKGLASMRSAALVPEFADVPLLRPLLGWRHSELEQICADAGVAPARDASNEDAGFERVRIRQALAGSGLLEPTAIARSAAILGGADAALDWAAEQAWHQVVTSNRAGVVISPSAIPDEIARRLVRRAIGTLATEGNGAELRGRDLDHMLVTLRSGGQATLRGVLCAGGTQWRFLPAPKRTGRRPGAP
jgi:tRNA(Ile)-lysidine synthase